MTIFRGFSTPDPRRVCKLATPLRGSKEVIF